MSLLKLTQVFLLLLIAYQPQSLAEKHKEELLIVTVATNNTDGFQRYLRSAKVNSLNGKVLGMGQEWLGGDMNYPGGGFKVNLLKKELEEHKDNPNLIIMFTDAYDVIFTGESDEILSRFKEFDARIVFGAEGFCWPKAELADKYPEVELGKRYLNSGGFIGYAPDLYEMVTSKELDNKDDDQLFYTEVFLNKELQKRWAMKLDNQAKIFQNLNGAIAEVELRFKDDIEPYLVNTVYDTKPLVIHGNGPSKRHLNHLGNYIPKAWNKEDQCTSCWEDVIKLEDSTEEPEIVLAIFIEQPTPFFEEFLEKIEGLDYSKNKIDLFIHNNEKYHAEQIEDFLKKVENLDTSYHSVTILRPEDNVKEWHARNKGIEKCVEVKCDYYFSVDADVHLDHPLTMQLLMVQNRNVIAPMMIRPYKAWSNFWGALTSDGFYARSTDYMDIVQNTRRGLWNVPYISSVYLIKGNLIHNKETRPSFVHRLLDPDMAFCANLRDKDIFFYVSNRETFGHLINSEDFKTDHKYNELWEIMSNQYDWEKRYIHEDYHKSLEEDAEIAQPCPDVFWFPIITERFADELVYEMEAYGSWSDGSNQDARLEGGYENVPTIDIHMNQVGYDKEWLRFLDKYVRPLQERVFWGYVHSPPRASMMFVVRYRPDEQPFLRPHHDASTYTINIALNNAGVDYTGGGCNFLRYNCSVPDTKKGWMLMHPGRLTHYHEGLTVTSGTRYIMVTFIDP